MRGATTSRFIVRNSSTFQSTRPMRGATICIRIASRRSICFNPRAPCGARHRLSAAFFCLNQFQSTRPMRGATPEFPVRALNLRVSIHAPHAGRDGVRCGTTQNTWCFNPRAPCGARQRQSGIYSHWGCFNPRAPCGARPAFCHFLTPRSVVSIHAPHAGRDDGGIKRRVACPVSIHAPHAGRDCHSASTPTKILCFNPRAPCGARLGVVSNRQPPRSFQSTRPMRGATRFFPISYSP